jgi:aminocarboxymuconate-semialdehyde decarboxylase
MTDITTSPKIVDAHAHALTLAVIEGVAEAAPSVNLSLTDLDADSYILQIAGIVQNPFPRSMFDLDRRFRDWASAGIDSQVVAPPPHFFLYDEDPAQTAATSAIVNDELSSLASANPGKFQVLSTVPLQSPEHAVNELERAMSLPYVTGVQIGTNFAGRNLDDPSLEPFWEAAAALGAFILVHPHKIAAHDRLKHYYLKNVIGNPLETTIAAASIVYSGVLVRHPNLKICLSHGGGFLPYQIGRFRHGWNVRESDRGALINGIDASLDLLLFDSIVHSEDTLAFLVDQAGPERVLLGSDYPFDMGTLDCVRQVNALKASQAIKDQILGGTARRLMSPSNVVSAKETA